MKGTAGDGRSRVAMGVEPAAVGLLPTGRQERVRTGSTAFLLKRADLNLILDSYGSECREREGEREGAVRGGKGRTNGSAAKKRLNP